jgi:phenylalanyl-tRNA synthetase beta chain
LDIAVVASDGIPASAVTAVVEEAAGPLCRGIRLFDVYSGSQVGVGRRSLAFALTFQAPDRTLTQEEVNQARDRIGAALHAALGATLRAG